MIFEFVYGHYSGNRYAILLQDEVLTVQMDAFDDGAKIDSSLGYRYVVDQGFCGSQGFTSFEQH